MDKEDEYTILLVDDSESDRSIYRRWLTQSKFGATIYQLIEFETGEEGLTWCHQKMPDIFLIDYFLPDMTGLDFLFQLKKNCQSEKIPAIILTSQGGTEIAVELFKEGAEDYLDKNRINEDSLRRSILGILKQFKLLKQLKYAEKKKEEALQQLNQNLKVKLKNRTLELQASEQTNRIILEAIPDLLLRLSREGNCLDYIQSKGNLETFLPAFSHLSEVLPPDLLAKQLQVIEEAIATKKLQIYEQQRVNQNRISYEEIRVLALNDQEILEIIRDISDRKQIEKNLQQTKEQFELAIQVSHDGFWDWNLETNEAYLSPRWKEMLGYEDHELLNSFDTWAAIVFEEDYHKVMQLLEDYNTGKVDQFLMTERFLHKNGSTVYVISKAIHIKDDQGKVIRMIGTHSDITEIMKIQNELETSKQFLQITTQQLEERINELNERNIEMRILSEMSDFLQSCITVEEACRAVTTIINSLFPNCSGGISIINNSRNYLETLSSWGTNFCSKSLFESNDCWALRKGKTHYISTPYQNLFCNHIHREMLPIESLCIAMIAQGETIGLFHMYALKDNQLSESIRQLANAIAEQISTVIANLILREKLQIQSIRDPLTNLFNRRYLEEFLTKEIHRAIRQDYLIGVVMIDLDHFKQINDKFSHDAGDLVLKEVASLLKKMIRSSDTACRYGGEELLLILPESTLKSTTQKAEEIRAAIAQLQLKDQQKQIIKITASFGVACFPDQGTTVTDIIKAADIALFQAKAGGRNQVVIS